jgi:HPt (histidine-containing phosphotransfer) domain-containing protein
MANMDLQIVDWASLAETRGQLGTSFIRILGYFREDGVRSIELIEMAMRAGDAPAMIMPSHKLKSEARQFGGERLGQLAEDIEMFARQCVETRETPEQYVDRVVQLRPLFKSMMDAIDAETSPLVQRHKGFGTARRVA